MKKYLIPVFIFFAISLFSGYSQTFEPPQAKRIDSTIILFGDTTHDYYAWMHDKNSTGFLNYLHNENDYAVFRMKHTELFRKSLLDKSRKKRDKDYVSDSTLVEGYWYYTRDKKGLEYPLFCRRKDTTGAKEEIYFDLNTLYRKYGMFSFLGSEPSVKKNFFAYFVNTDGTDYGTLYIKHLSADTSVIDSVKNITDFFWATDSLIVYEKTDTSGGKWINGVYIHKLGNGKDSLLWFHTDKKSFINISNTSSYKYLIINKEDALSNEIYIADTATFRFKLVKPSIAGFRYSMDNLKKDSVFYIHVNENGRDKLYTCDTANFSFKNRKLLMKFPDSVILESYFIYNKYFLFKFRSKKTGLQFFVIRNKQTGKERIIKPDLSSYVLYVSKYYGRDSSKFLYSVTNFVLPPQDHIFYFETGTDSVIKRKSKTKLPDMTGFETKRIYVPAYDNKSIPVDIVYKKGLKLDGNSPLLLKAYASYGMIEEPYFDYDVLFYLKKGFVYALAHPRGEGILGEEWHREGMGINKINTVKDFLAVSGYLIDKGYTSPGKLVIRGGSAGGMLVTAAVTQRPDLYRCVIAEVPMADVLYQLRDTAWENSLFHLKEMGNPFDSAGYFALKQWCPYQNIRDTAYPYILVTAAMNDTRVPVWNPAKWVAKLRYHKKDTNMLLLLTDMQGGHQGPMNPFEGQSREAFIKAFILNSLGINENYLEIKGKVLDENGNPLPYVNIIVKGTTKGTTTNYDGEFSLVLKGDTLSVLVFKYVGFKTKEVPVNLKTKTYDMKVVLHSEATLLHEVIVTADGKDPAYGIMKKVRKKRKYYLKNPSKYSVKIYVKKEGRLNEIPEKLPWFIEKSLKESGDSIPIGLFELSEATFDYYFMAPDHYKEIMTGSKKAGTSYGYSWNRAGDVMINFYVNYVANYISDRGFVSPVASMAPVYYKFKLEDIIKENNQTIYKIKVIPRRKHDPVFSGYVYVVKDAWCLAGIDLTVTKKQGLQFMDSLKIKQNFVPVNDSLWLPFSVDYTEYFRLFGFGLHNKVVGTLTDYNLNPPIDEKFFGYKTYEIQKEANKKDSLYWEEKRIVSLTDEEKKYYHQEDSLMKIRKDPARLDSLRKKYNKFHFSDIFFGYDYSNYSKRFLISVKPLIGFNNFYYNTVEGLVYRNETDIYFFSKQKVEEDRMNKYHADRYIRFKTAYSLTNRKFYGNILAMPVKNIYINAGRKYKIINRMPEIVNEIYTLLLKENYAKYYQADYFSIYTGEYYRLARGLHAGATLKYESRKPAYNSSFFSFYDYLKKDNDKKFTPNEPAYKNFALKPHNVFKTRVDLFYIFKEVVEETPYEYENYYSTSKLPSLYLFAETGYYPSKHSAFGYLELSTKKVFRIDMVGRTFLKVVAGKFLFGSQNLEFVDYKHFIGNQTFLLNSANYNTELTFNTLNYFDYSTNDGFWGWTAEHHFQGWIVNKFPLLRKTKLQVLGGMGTLYTFDKGMFSEVYAGVENLFNVFRIDLVGTYQNKVVKPVLRIGLKFMM